MDLEKELESLYIDQFKDKIQKQAITELGIPSSELESEQKSLDVINSKIDSYEVPQNIKDKIQLKSYQHYLEFIEDIKTAESIFGHCFCCEYVKLDDINYEEKPYCLEEKKDCDKVMAGNSLCLKMKEADPSKMDDVLRLINETDEECKDKEIVIAKQILEALKQEITNKYSHNQNILRERI